MSWKDGFVALGLGADAYVNPMFNQSDPYGVRDFISIHLANWNSAFPVEWQISKSSGTMKTSNKHKHWNPLLSVLSHLSTFFCVFRKIIYFTHSLLWIIYSGQAVLVHTPPKFELDAPAWLTVADVYDTIFTVTTCTDVYITLGTYIYNDRINTYKIHLSNNISTIHKDDAEVRTIYYSCIF